ncbi:hypothetical protein ACN42_g1829 [Penicillium freii]|uniref:Uncharacterized protein n=1 Tax=Penicillium freii TaxID=48697 RepID=A0A101MRA1_PENFR|nr:hypothetical protein ACN42_g1829 [Penicillium freii]
MNLGSIFCAGLLIPPHVDPCLYIDGCSPWHIPNKDVGGQKWYRQGFPVIPFMSIMPQIKCIRRLPRISRHRIIDHCYIQSSLRSIGCI